MNFYDTCLVPYNKLKSGKVSDNVKVSIILKILFQKYSQTKRLKKLQKFLPKDFFL